MKYAEFHKKMQKDVFTTQEAQLVAFQDDPKLTNLQLHSWQKRGELIRLKQGAYMFSNARKDIAQIAQVLYGPCYFSLEYVLNLFGVIPEAVFAYTLVTTKPTRRFVTPAGTFIFHTIKKQAFTGFDPKTLMAEPEKALIDYFYLHQHSFRSTVQFWKESRLYAGNLNFKKIFRYAKLFNSKKLTVLLQNFQEYAQSHS